ncbi:MAG: GlsB/YeaQ/YmgE family stress response membrane protein [Rhizobiales bacterium]|nr:GlsB/YeaQ/YmgE family stress response membrane protein [Hyphomicrobiales bacterium]
MGEMQGILGQPGVGLITMLIIGVIAGWIAEKVTASDHGILTNILVGIAGAFIGGKLAEVLQIPVFGFVRLLIAATIGAIIILFVWRRLRSSS